MASNNPFFIDLNVGVIGAYIGFEEKKGGDSEFGRIRYQPFNSFGKSVLYHDDVKFSHVIPLIITDTGQKGIPKNVTIHYNPQKPSVFGDFLDNRNKQRVTKLEDENKNLKQELAKYKQQVKDLSTSTTRAVASAKKMTGTRESSSDIGVGLNRFSSRLPGRF